MSGSNSDGAGGGRRFAIIGAGPAGLYAADRLSRGDAGASIDIYDRLTTPLGLIRYGVAPDHQSTKNIARMLLKVFERPGVAFHGGVRIGPDQAVTLDRIRAAYDGVILATGCPTDRALTLDGAPLPGLLTAGRFVGWYNAHPDHRTVALPDAVRHAVVIGAGNVALDIARLLAKTEEEWAGSDLDPAKSARLAGWPLQTITIVARRGAGEVKFTAPELSEIGKLARAAPFVAPNDLPTEDTPILALLRGYTEPRTALVEIRFRFNLTPVAAIGLDRLTALRFRDAAGGMVELPADLAVSSIGFQDDGALGLACQSGVLINQDGRIDAGLYAVGWAARGATGTIPFSRADAHRIADRVLAETGAAGKAGAAAIIAANGSRPTGFADWQLIDAAERAAAGPGRVRLKR